MRPRDWAHTQAQLKYYESVLGAAASLVVVPEMRGWDLIGATTPDALVSRLAAIAAQTLEDTPRAVSDIGPVKRLLFAAMPFKPEYDDVYFFGMRPAAEELEATCTRIDHEQIVGDVSEAIRERLRECVAVIGDLSEARPNVLYELGFAHALQKPAILICSTPLDELPFDIRNHATIPYVRGQTRQLQVRLVEHLRPLVGA